MYSNGANRRYSHLKRTEKKVDVVHEEVYDAYEIVVLREDTGVVLHYAEIYERGYYVEAVAGAWSTIKSLTAECKRRIDGMEDYEQRRARFNKQVVQKGKKTKRKWNRWYNEQDEKLYMQGKLDVRNIR